MGNLTNKYIKDTYDGLIKLADETQGVQPTLQKLQDGLGNDLPAEVSTTEFNITGSLVGNADTATSASHALQADNADSASYVLGNAVDGPVSDAISSSYALTASFAENVQDDIYVSGATFYSGTTGNLNLHRTAGESDVVVNLDGRYLLASAGQSQDLRLDFIEAATASLNNFTASAGPRLDSLESKTGSYATTGSNVFTGQQQINNDLIVQGDLYVSGSETIISSSTLIVGDREIELNANRTVGDAGIIVYDVISPETTGSLQYDAIENWWKIGQKGSEQRVVDVSMTGSMTVLSSSYATTASYADTAGSAPAADTALRTVVTGKNVTASPIPKGTPCFVTGSGTNGNLVGIIPADASNPSLMPATVIAGEDINSGDEGEVIVDGFINGVDTSLFAAGQSVYVAVGGGYTNQRPTGSANLVQKLGNVEKSAINGSGLIKGPGWYNDIPNIQEGYFWAGDADGVAQAISTGSFARRDEPNTFSEDQQINGSLYITSEQTNALLITSGSGTGGSINFNLQNFGSSQPTIFFSGDNSYFQADGNFSIENSPGGQGTGSMNFTTNGYFGIATNGTGSENIALSTATGNFNFNVAGGANTLNVTSSNFILNSTYLKNNSFRLENRSSFYNSGSILNGLGTSTTSTLTMGPAIAGRFKRNEYVTLNANFDEQASGKHVVAWYDYSADYFDNEMGLSTTTGLDGSNKVFYLQAGKNNGSSGNTVWWTGEDGYWHILKDMKIENSVEITGSLTAGGGSNLYGTNTVDGGGQLFVNGYFQANGQTEMNNGLTITGSINHDGSIDSTGDVYANRLFLRGGTDTDLVVTGSVSISDSLTVDGGIGTTTGNLNLNGIDKIILSGSNQLNINTSNFTLTDSTLNTIIQKPGSGQNNLIDINGQVGFYSGYPAMTQVNFGLQSISSQYNGFVFELYDSPSYNWGTDFAISANGVYAEVEASGSGNVADFNVYATSAGTTYGNLRAQNIDIGDFSTLDIDIASAGPNSTVTGLYGNNVDIGSPFGYTNDIDIDANNFIRLVSTQIDISGSVNVVNGSMNISEKANLAPQDPLPAGSVGDLAVSGSNELYFHNGTAWTLVV